jgi:hypothetical protein
MNSEGQKQMEVSGFMKAQLATKTKANTHPISIAKTDRITTKHKSKRNFSSRADTMSFSISRITLCLIWVTSSIWFSTPNQLSSDSYKS